MLFDLFSLFILSACVFYSMHKRNPKSHLPICHARGHCSACDPVDTKEASMDSVSQGEQNLLSPKTPTIGG